MQLPTDWDLGLGTVKVPGSLSLGLLAMPFQQGTTYQMVVWPIPQATADTPTQILTDLGFDVANAAANADGSVEVTAKLTGPSFSSSSDDAASTYVFDAATVQPAFQPGELVYGQTSSAQDPLVSEYDDPGNPECGVLVVGAFTSALKSFQAGEVLLGMTSSRIVIVTYQYTLVLKSPVSGGMLGLSVVPVPVVVQGSPSSPIHVNPPIVFPTPVKKPAPACGGGTILDTVTGVCAQPCPDGSAPAAGACGTAKATGPVTCGAGTIADSVTGKCVAPCTNGGAPVNGICPVAPPATVAASTSTGTYVAVGLGVLGAGAALYYATR